MDTTVQRYWEKELRDTIHNNGKSVYIKYHMSSSCPTCVLDPVSGEGRFNCSTCHGTGKWNVSTTLSVKGVVNQFLGNGGFIKYGNEKISLEPVGNARVTVWLPDVQRNPFIATSKTYFSSADSVYIGGSIYAVKDIAPIGFGDTDTVCVVTLVRKGNES